MSLWFQHYKPITFDSNREGLTQPLAWSPWEQRGQAQLLVGLCQAGLSDF